MPRILITVCAFIAILGWSDAAWSMRCGNKLVQTGMREVEIIALCGEPVSSTAIGTVLRYYDPYGDDAAGSYIRYSNGYRTRGDLLVTEMLFNFGPHKLMRVLRFEGGQLVSIETAGYGFRDKK